MPISMNGLVSRGMDLETGWVCSRFVRIIQDFCIETMKWRRCEGICFVKADGGSRTTMAKL